MATKFKDVGKALESQPEAHDVLRSMVERMVREVLAQEVEAHVGAGRYARGGERRGQRNGTKARTLKTRVGKLELEVPQVRGMEPYHPSLFGRWERSERALLAACAEMYFLGVSTRKVTQVMETMGGFSMSAASVSRVAAELDESLSAFRERRLDHTQWPHLVVDALYLKVRHNHKIVSRAVLIVAGVSSEGTREILSWRVDDSESQDTWSAIFTDLKRRGASGVATLTSDGHQGIQAAARRCFPDTQWQRCRVHFMRNALAKVSDKERHEAARDLRAIFQSGQPEICLLTAREIAGKWSARRPKLAQQIESQVEECLAVHSLPRNAVRKLHSTNLLERLNREIRRRTNVVGIFPSIASCERLVGVILLEHHESWTCEDKRYIIPEAERIE